jgi:general secretion pathway protein G
MARRCAFTLVELVVVIMILGILAAVAVPKLIGTTANATDGGLKQTLSVVRDSIEMYAAEHGGQMPPADDEGFKEALKPYLRATKFPKCPVGSRKDTVKFSTVTDGGELPIDGNTGWIFNSPDGRFIANCSDTSNDTTTSYKDF